MGLLMFATYEDVGEIGNYWTSTIGPYQTGDAVSEGMNIDSNRLSVASTQNSRAEGYSIRCVAR